MNNKKLQKLNDELDELTEQVDRLCDMERHWEEEQFYKVMSANNTSYLIH